MIKGFFTSKRGISWNYSVNDYGYVEQWRDTIVKKSIGCKSKTIYTNPTKECIEYIQEKHGIKCKR